MNTRIFQTLRNKIQAKPLVSGLVGFSSLTAGTIAYCSSDHIDAPAYGWSHDGAFGSYDYAAIRRGFQVMIL